MTRRSYNKNGKAFVFDHFEKKTKDGFPDTFNHGLGEDITVGNTGSITTEPKNMFFQFDGDGLNGAFASQLREKGLLNASNKFLQNNLKKNGISKDNPTSNCGKVIIVYLEQICQDRGLGTLDQALTPIKKIAYTASPNLVNLDQERAKAAMTNFGKELYKNLKDKEVKRFLWPFFSGGVYKGNYQPSQVAEWQIEGFLDELSKDQNPNGIECIFSDKALMTAFENKKSVLEEFSLPEQKNALFSKTTNGQSTKQNKTLTIPREITPDKQPLLEQETSPFTSNISSQITRYKPFANKTQENPSNSVMQATAEGIINPTRVNENSLWSKNSSLPNSDNYTKNRANKFQTKLSLSEDNFAKLFCHIVYKANEKSGSKMKDIQDILDALAFAQTNGGISNKYVRNGKYETTNPDEIQQKRWKEFSKKYQDLAKEYKIFTGRDNPAKLVGARFTHFPSFAEDLLRKKLGQSQSIDGLKAEDQFLKTVEQSINKKDLGR